MCVKQTNRPANVEEFAVFNLEFAMVFGLLNSPIASEVITLPFGRPPSRLHQVQEGS